MEIHTKHAEWIEARGISLDLASRLGLFTKAEGGKNWLAVPYRQAGEAINHKFRLCSEKRHRMDTGAPLLWWNIDCLNDPRVQSASHPVVITEGEWDAMAAMQAGRPHVLSVPNGAPAEPTAEGPIDAANDAERFAFLHRATQITDTVAKFILATDSDGPGRVLAFELVRRLGAERCMFVTYPAGCKDLNDVLLAHGEGGVAAVLSDAKPYPVKGLGRISDFPEPPPFEPIRIHIPLLHDMLPVIPGTFTVVTGYAGQGKTSAVMAVVADMLRQGHNVALASFETAVKPILETKLRAHLLGCSDSDTARCDTSRADAMLEAQLSIIAQQPGSDDDDMTLDDCLELARIAVIRDGIKMLIIDPWNEIEHKRRADESETDYTGRAIRAMKRFARNYQVAVWLIAHPRKPVIKRRTRRGSRRYSLLKSIPYARDEKRPRRQRRQTAGAASWKAPHADYDISGSANFANKADFGVIVHRPSRDSNLVDLHVTKVRMGLPGRMGDARLEWNWQSSRYDAPMTFADSDA